MSEEEELIYGNGIAGDTGKYLVPPLTTEQISRIVQEAHINASYLSEIQWEVQHRYERQLLLSRKIKPNNLTQTGWGVIFAQQGATEQRDRLKELLEHPRTQAQDRYREFTYKSGKSKLDFLERHGVGPGIVNPDKVPYYLLIAASPEEIPYEFQFQLDVSYAVGRVHFTDNEDYKNYATSVVRAEVARSSLPRSSIFFGPRNPGDWATQRSADYLVKPLADSLKIEEPDWHIKTIIKDEAVRSRLCEVLSNAGAPSLLFVACHGVGFANGNPRQIESNGALLCQDWPGPLQWEDGKPFPEEMYFASGNVDDDMVFAGRIAIFFACYGAGTPKADSFARLPTGLPVEIAPQSFVAGLPRRMLAHPKGGALAVVGHVERAWPSSFRWRRAGQQLDTFADLMGRLMKGDRLGSAFEGFNARYAELFSDLGTELRDIIRAGKTPNKSKLADLWLAHEDARGYVVIGDPAVRLNIGE